MQVSILSGVLEEEEAGKERKMGGRGGTGMVFLEA